MAQINGGLRTLLGIPVLFKFFTRVLGGIKETRELVNHYICPHSGDRVLDIGCGTGRIIDFLPQVEYHGFDSNSEYISAAKREYGGRANFHCERVTEANLKAIEYFDIVLAIGILHHLDDDEAAHLFQLAKKALKPGGRLITIDCTFAKGQSPIARWIISRDRGQNVRTADEYSKLARGAFVQITCDIRHDLLHIPYTHTILRCTKI